MERVSNRFNFFLAWDLGIVLDNLNFYPLNHFLTVKSSKLLKNSLIGGLTWSKQDHLNAFLGIQKKPYIS